MSLSPSDGKKGFSLALRRRKNKEDIKKTLIKTTPF
jgi:hypothetical protein